MLKWTAGLSVDKIDQVTVSFTRPRPEIKKRREDCSVRTNLLAVHP
jgi:hypothetical protein